MRFEPRLGQLLGELFDPLVTLCQLRGELGLLLGQELVGLPFDLVPPQSSRPSLTAAQGLLLGVPRPLPQLTELVAGRAAGRLVLSCAS